MKNLEFELEMQNYTTDQIVQKIMLKTKERMGKIDE